MKLYEVIADNGGWPEILAVIAAHSEEEAIELMRTLRPDRDFRIRVDELDPNLNKARIIWSYNL